MKLWTLVENTSCNENLKNEHGLSFYIETQNHKILFDFGQSDIFLENANKMGIDLSKVDIAILSHGHYDHGGGLKKFLQINSFAKIYINKNAFNLHYNGTEKYIGLDLSLKDNERFIFVDDELIIDEELSLYSCNNAQKTFPINPYGLKVREENKFFDEDFIHEQYLLIEENNSNKKKILISGCSHKGIINIQNWFNPDILIGGFHFMKLSVGTKDVEELKTYSKILNDTKTIFYTCHCTGVEQFDFLKNYMTNKLNYLSSGSFVEV